MISDTIHIVVSSNENYLPGVFVTLGSLLDSASTSSTSAFHLHVLDTGITSAGRAKLSAFIRRFPNAELCFHTIDQTGFTGLRRDYGGGFSAYARLLMGSLIDAPRCVYLDVDILVLKDVTELFHRDMDGRIMFAVRDYEPASGKPATLDHDCPYMTPEESSKLPYYVTGILLCDLDAWRAFGTENKSFGLMRQFPSELKAWDQTVLNYVLRDHTGELHRDWARYIDSNPFVENANYHYISRRKPWDKVKFPPQTLLWHAYYDIRVRPHYRYHKPLKTRVANICWYLRTFVFSFGFAGLYLHFLRKRGTPENILAAKRVLLRSYRHHILHGLDPQSRAVLDNLKHHWKFPD